MNVSTSWNFEHYSSASCVFFSRTRSCCAHFLYFTRTVLASCQHELNARAFSSKIFWERKCCSLWSVTVKFLSFARGCNLFLVKLKIRNSQHQLKSGRHSWTNFSKFVICVQVVPVFWSFCRILAMIFDQSFVFGTAYRCRAQPADDSWRWLHICRTELRIQSPILDTSVAFSESYLQSCFWQAFIGLGRISFNRFYHALAKWNSAVAVRDAAGTIQA